MLTELACEALRQGRILTLRYGGFSRDIELHACGYTKHGHAVIRGWQLNGQAGERAGWNLLWLDEASGGEISESASEAPRKGFKLDDPAMDRIVCEVSLRR